MRKGRSSRRSRISRPLVSVKGEALSTDAGPASQGSPRPSPRVVVGVPPSDPPPSETIESPSPESPSPSVMEAKAPVTTRSSTVIRGSVVDRDADLPPPPSEPPVDAKVEEPPVVAAPDFAATAVHGSSEAPKVEPSFAKTLAFGSKLNELPQSERVEASKVEVPRDRRDVLKEKRARAQEAQKAISPKEDPDEISVPPANDLNVEDEKFFSEADIAVRKSVHEFEMLAQREAEEAVPEKARRKLDPHVIRRRERFAGYVKIAVAVAGIVCLAAVGRSALHGRTETPAPAAPPIAVAPETPPVQPTPVEPKQAEPAAAPIAEPTPEEAKPEEAKPAEEAKPEEAKAEEAKPAEPAAEEIAGDAKEELKKSRTALEKRKIPEAIEAGERSVALDPTDGEAWLILGAAYQEKGDLVNARRAYGACVKQGKTGPRLECQKMLR